MERNRFILNFDISDLMGKAILEFFYKKGTRNTGQFNLIGRNGISV